MPTAQPPQTTDSELSPPRWQKEFRRGLKRALVGVACFYVVWCIALYFGQRWLIYPRFALAEPAMKPDDKSATIEFRRSVDGGEAIAWFVPAPGASAQHPAPLVLYVHGNSDTIESVSDRIDGYRNLGCNIVLPEYRGYGRSHGEPSEQAILDDALWAFDQALQRPEVDKLRVFAHGSSLGSSIAARVAEQRGGAALILDSAFPSLPEAGRQLLIIPAGLIAEPYQLEAVIARLQIPILLFHGTEDWIVTPDYVDRLRGVAQNGAAIKIACGHQHFPCEDEVETYWHEIAVFLRANKTLPATGGPASH